MYLIFLQMKAPAKWAHCPIQNCPLLDQSAQAKEVQATNTAPGNANMNCIAIYSLMNQPMV
jgi:hypothetical protein